MSKDEKAILTKLELQIMQVIWRCGESSVNAVRDRLEKPLAYTTVQTMLNILERKGQLTRKLEGRAYVYSAAVTETSAVGQAVRDLINRMFAGSGEDLVMSLIQSRHLNADKLTALVERLKDQEGGDR